MPLQCVSVVAHHSRIFSSQNPRHQHIKAPRIFARDAKADGVPRFGAFDGGERQGDASPPAVVGEVLLAHQPRLAQLTEQGVVEQYVAAAQAVGGRV